jgi:ubiquinone/menaquinone biosynthesis C-methylase UbiE
MIELFLKIDHGIEISRVRRSKKAAKRVYNRLSGVYDLLEGRWENEARAAGLQRLHFMEGEDVLEIGPGTGQALLALARSTGALGKVYAIDISPKMLQRTRKRLGDAGFHDRARLILGDGARLPLKPSSFDAIFMSFTLELFDTQEIAQVLSECRRVLKSQGRICVLSLSKTGGSELMKKFYELGRERFPDLLDCRPIFVHESLQDAGFKAELIDYSSLWGMPVETVVGIT